MTNHCQKSEGRSAFTLIELLVVLFLLAFISGLAILFLPGLDEQQRAPRGAIMLQQWCVIAKNNAMRDRMPWGIRLSVTTMQDPLNANATLTIANQAQYIQAPGDFAVTPGVMAAPGDATGTTLPVRRIYTSDATLMTISLEPTNNATASDFSGGFGSQAGLWPVQIGDYLEVNGGLPHRIVGFPSGSTTSLTLASPLPAAIPYATASFQFGTANYRVLRSPRVVGEDQLQLPADIIVDLGTNAATGQPIPVDPVTSTIDILFSPSGAVITRGTMQDAIYLWVRDSNLPVYQGDNTVVAIQVRSGAVFAYPVNNAPGGDPYLFAKTGNVPQS